MSEQLSILPPYGGGKTATAPGLEPMRGPIQAQAALALVLDAVSVAAYRVQAVAR